MDCKQFERLIPDFIQQEMDYRTLNKFIKHIENCPKCKEELVIQFLIAEGMVRLEEGSAFDLNKELELRIQESKRKIKSHNRFVGLSILLELIIIFVIVAVIVWILVL